MRAILTLLAIAVLVVAVLIYVGVIKMSFKAWCVKERNLLDSVGSVSFGKKTETVTVPTINVQRAGAPDNAAAAH